MGITLKTDYKARDCGADGAVGQITTKTQHKREVDAKYRAARIRYLVYRTPKARKLVKTGMVPSMTYAPSNMGIRPTGLKTRQRAITTGLNMPRGACATTGIIWYLDEEAVPKIKFRTQAFKDYFRYLRDYSDRHDRIEEAWPSIKLYLSKFQKPWRHVSGPVGSIVMPVYELGLVTSTSTDIVFRRGHFGI